MPETLSVTNNRNDTSIEIPVNGTFIRATDLRKISQLSSGNVNVSEPLRILDPGFQLTAVMETSVSEIDKVTGDIRYRGFSIHDLIEKHDFDDVVHLLIFGRVPTSSEKAKLRKCIAEHMDPPKTVIDTIQAMPQSAPTFTMLMAGLTMWNAQMPDIIPVAEGGPMYLKNPVGSESPGDVSRTATAVYRTLGAMAVVVALVSCHVDNIEFTQPDPKSSLAGNLLRMCGKLGDSDEEQSHRLVALNKILIISADHEMTNSTAAFLHATSSGADPISAAVSGIASAFGPLHAGAIQMAYRQYEMIGSPENVDVFVKTAKQDGRRIAGLGHRVWKDMEDPRLKIVRAVLDKIPGATNQPLVSIAMELDKVIAKDPYFTDRRIKPNVDLYNCFAYTAMGFWPAIGPLIAAYARIAGALAHWQEQLSQPPCLWRPTAVFKDSNNNSNSSSSAGSSILALSDSEGKEDGRTDSDVGSDTSK